MRPLIQYDLDESTSTPASSLLNPPRSSNTRRPPVKKRKRNHHNAQKYPPAQSQKTPLQHWDDPGSTAVRVMYDEQEAGTAPPAPVNSVMVNADDFGEKDGEYGEEAVEDSNVGEEEEESRPLTHEDIWDDSALIDAWNSAEAEYEAYHGTSQAWKAEPVKKSPLWYNKPYIPASSKPGVALASPPQAQEDSEHEPDTASLDFHTYVPTHDPSLSIPSDGAAANPASTTTPFFAPPPSATMVSRDEAFNNAMSAMYWCGYWTAVYQCQGRSNGTDDDVLLEAVGEPNGIEADEADEEEDLVPTQR